MDEQHADGTGQAQFTSFGDVVAPGVEGGQLAWSPDSSKLLFVRGSNPYAIWVINANGQLSGKAETMDAIKTGTIKLTFHPVT